MAGALANVTKVWKDFNLVVFQTELDQVATDLAERQDNREQSRKRLIELNKEFKKNSTPETKKQVAPLLKSFQNEIDELTIRSKAAESAFLNVYKKVVDAPDPVPSLEFVQSLQLKAAKVADLELENGKLRETLSEYNKEFADVKNQEVTVKNLREKIKELEDSVEARVASKVSEKERELAKSYEEKNQLLASSQLDLEKRLTDSEHSSHALQSAYNAAQTELFELRSRLDDEQSAKNSEMELVLGDLDVANQKLAAAEKEIMDLHSQLSELRSSQSDGQFASSANENEAMEEAFQRYANSSLEAELVAKERQIEQLVEENRKLNASLSSTRSSAAAQRQKLQQEYSNLEQQIEAMKEKLDQQRDYAEIKRELDIMKSVEFNVQSGEQDTSQAETLSKGSTPDIISGSVVSKQSLELLLLEKNKKLQNDNTKLRNNNSTLQGDSVPIAKLNRVVDSLTCKSESLSVPSSSSQSSVLSSSLLKSLLNKPSSSTSISRTQLLNLSSDACEVFDRRDSDEVMLKSNESLGSKVTVSVPSCLPTVPNDDSDLDSVVDVSDGSQTHGSTQNASAELFSPENIAEKVSTELTLQGLSVKFLAKELNIPDLRGLIDEPKTFSDLSHSEFISYLELLKWLKLQGDIKEEQSKPKSAEETNEAIQRILESAKKEMMGVSTKCPSIVESSPKSPRDYSFAKTFGSPGSDTVGIKNETQMMSPLRIFNNVRSPGSRLSVLAQLRRMLVEPLTPEDVSKYSDCDTQVVADKVRKVLENNSISQRVFGHYILGMSQSSVSDLLLHPKPWGSTTGKGQASYIRMQKWLENKSGIERLKQLNSTFIIDVLSNIQQLNGESQLTSRLTSSEILSACSKTKEIVLNIPKVTQPKVSIQSAVKSEAGLSPSNFCSKQTSVVPPVTTNLQRPQVPVVVTFAPIAPKPGPNLTTWGKVSVPMPYHPNKLQLSTNSLPITTSCNAKSFKLRRSIKLTEEIFECYSLFGIDTVRLTDQVKVLMSTRSIGQKVLGENILGLCQASVCDLLNKPRSWSGLHRRVKEAYIRLQIWANNPASFPLVDSYGDPLSRRSNSFSGDVSASSESRQDTELDVPPSKRSKLASSDSMFQDCFKSASQVPVTSTISQQETNQLLHPSIQKLTDYVGALSQSVQHSLGQGQVTASNLCNTGQGLDLTFSSGFEDSSDNRVNAKVEAAAADFVQSYLSNEDNEDTGDRLLSALGFSDDSSNDEDDLSAFQFTSFEDTAIVHPKSPEGALKSVIDPSISIDTEEFKICPKLTPEVAAVRCSSLESNTSDSDLELPFIVSSQSEESDKQEKNSYFDRAQQQARITALENTICSASEPWNDQIEAINLISKMQSNLAQMPENDSWSDSPDSLV